MNIARMEKFEALWSVRHDLPAESLAQYRFESREGYRLPELAAHYRTFVSALDSIEIRLPVLNPEMFSCNVVFGHEKARAEAEKAIKSAGLKVAE